MVVQSANQVHHDAHAVLWPRVKLAAHLGVEEGVAGVSDGVACLPCADGDEGVTACRSIKGLTNALQPIWQGQAPWTPQSRQNLHSSTHLCAAQRSPVHMRTHAYRLEHQDPDSKC